MSGGFFIVRGPKGAQRRAARGGCAGFSLIELFIVMCLLLILVSVYWGSVSRSGQSQQRKNCQTNLQKVSVAMDIFANDHAGKFPDVAGARTSEEALEGLVPRYTVDTGIFICPGSGDAVLPAGESFAKKKISYAYYMGRSKMDATEVLLSDQQVDALPKAAGRQVFSATGKPPGNNHRGGGGNFLFCDGRVEASAANAAFSLVFTQGVVLLNP